MVLTEPNHSLSIPNIFLPLYYGLPLLTLGPNSLAKEATDKWIDNCTLKAINSVELSGNTGMKSF